MKKQLMEKRADLLKSMEALSNKDSFSAEDQSSFDSLKAQVADVDRQLASINAVEGMRANQAVNAVTDSEEKEISKHFSFSEAISQARDGRLTGFIAEMHQEAVNEARNSGISLANGAHTILIPTAVQQAKIFANTATPVIATEPAQGGRAVATELRSFVDYLWANLVLAQLGADFIPGLVGNISFPVENAVPVMNWKSEVGAADQSSPTFLLNEMKPKKGTTFVDVSNQVIAQTAGAMQARIARQLAGAASRGIEGAAISGTGNNDQPRGILHTSGIGDVIGGTHGGAPTWAHIVDLETKVAVENADIGALGYLTNTKVRGKLKTTSKVSGQNGFVWEDDNTMNGYRTGVTNLVPSNLTKGDAVGTASAIIFGNFNDLIIGQWGPIEIMANPYTKAKSGVTELILNVYVDTLVQRAKSFAAMKDALTV
jgi:HK97 family phage major capsid protein